MVEPVHTASLALLHAIPQRPSSGPRAAVLRFSLAFCFLAASALLHADYDVVLRDGRVIDGSGAPAQTADVAIKNGRIVVVGQVTGRGEQEVDVRGATVVPGFIDVHTHAENIEASPRGENFVRMGVTTLVLGNCGSSAANIRALFHRVESNGVAPNVATLVGHGTVRKRAMDGSFDREPTADELREMETIVGQAMHDGALGLSTGLIYLPGTFAKTAEILALAKVAGRHGGLYASHMRSESERIFEALDELFHIAREGDLPAHVSHIKLSGRSNWNQAAKVLDAIESARKRGLRITHDQYVYTASSTSTSTLVPKQYREGDRFAEHYANPETKSRMMSQMRSLRERSGSPDYSYAVIAEYRKNRALNGLTIAQAAKKLRGSDSLDDQIETILDIQKQGGASAVFHGINEVDLQAFMRHTNTMFASDSGVRIYNEGVPHPRGYGNNARVLSRYVRQLQIVQPEEAIRRMTSLPAATFKIKDRGRIAPGYWADIVVLDPAAVRDNATFDEPHQYATGFKRVYVNGVAVVADDRHTGAKPGRAVRRNL